MERAIRSRPHDLPDGLRNAVKDTAPRIAIIGAGVAGLGMGYYLKKAGFESFAIFEKARDIGGVWRENTYPGITCDVPSHLYSYSFAPNPDWSRRFSPGAEIQAYFENVAQRYGVADRIRYGTARAAMEAIHKAGVEDVQIGTDEQKPGTASGNGAKAP